MGVWAMSRLDLVLRDGEKVRWGAFQRLRVAASGCGCGRCDRRDSSGRGARGARAGEQESRRAGAAEGGANGEAGDGSRIKGLRGD